MSCDHDHQHAPSTDRHRSNPRAPQSLDRKLGVRVRDYRQHRGMSQQTLAERCGLSAQQLQKYEGGYNRMPASRLHQIAVALNVSIIELLQPSLDEASTSSTPAVHRHHLRERLNSATARLEDRAFEKLVEFAETITAPAPL